MEKIPPSPVNKSISFPNDYNDPISEEDLKAFRKLFKKYYLLEDPHPVFGNDNLFQALVKRKDEDIEMTPTGTHETDNDASADANGEEKKDVPPPPPPA